MILHEQITLKGHVEIFGAKVETKKRKRAIYHKQRGANTKSKTIVRTCNILDDIEAMQRDMALKFESAQGREQRRINQKETRRAKR